MLLYNKTLDPFHTLLRCSSILYAIDLDVIEEDRLRIFDFIVAQPSHIPDMSLSRNLLSIKNNFKKYKNSYDLYDPNVLFISMKPIQQVAFLCLIENFILLPVEGTKRYQINRSAFSEKLLKIIKNQNNSISEDTIVFIKEHLTDLTLLGDKGLKSVSKLMGYSHDSVI